MDNLQEKLKLSGTFYFKHIRNGKIIDEGTFKNKFMNEGLVYALNSAFGVPVGGAPSPVANWYIGLSTANRTWLAGDSAETIGGSGGVAAELEDYDEATRQAWLPQALALTSSIELDSTGAEATFTINAASSVYGAFIIDNNDKSGVTDAASNILVAGSNFTNAPRSLEDEDVFKVGYILPASSLT